MWVEGSIWELQHDVFVAARERESVFLGLKPTNQDLIRRKGMVIMDDPLALLRIQTGML